MNQKDTQLDRLIAGYWADGGDDVEKARKVVTMAVAHPPPGAPRVLARAVQVSRRADADALADRVEALSARLDRTRRLLGLVDVLGSELVEAEQAVFDDLADFVPEVDLDGVEPKKLQRAKAGAAHRPEAAAKLLDALGWDRVPEPTRSELRNALREAAAAATGHHARLLVTTPHPVGLLLGIHVAPSERDGVRPHDTVSRTMEKQAVTVLDSYAAKDKGVVWSVEWPAEYAGESLGLALKLAAKVAFDGVRPDPLLAATGAVLDTGQVAPVENVAAKLSAAHENGMRRVLLPEENREDAESAGLGDELELLFVEHVDDIAKRLSEASVRSEFSLDGRVRLARASLQRFGLSEQAAKQTQNSMQLHVTDAAGKAIVNVFTGERGRVTAGGPAAPTREVVERLIADVFEREPAEKREPVGWTVADDWRQKQLREGLERAGAEEREAKGTGEVWRYQLRRGPSVATITLWRTGKTRLTGDAPAFDEIVALAEQALQGLANVRLPGNGAAPGVPAGAPELPREGPWVGTDESGKGDYFGPLVSAAVFVDESIARELEEIGVRDSKKLTDRRVRDLAPQVKQVTGGRFKVTSIMPPRYNELYAEFRSEGKSLNSLLAWGHTRSIKDLLERGFEPTYAIVDQFADARYIKERLMAEAESGLQVFQFPKAESDIAVAAASILAREAFLDWLARQSAKLGVTLPKGASQQVIDVGRGIYAQGGREALGQVAKLSFKTTQKVVA